MDHNHVARGAPHLVPASARHESVDSPAAALQARIDAAMTSGAWTSAAIEPHVDRWPGAARVAVILIGAGASWVLAWQLFRLILRG
ncbi:hypothetical protein [Sphingomonas guangdongensis]|uniref:hypothetical protein n=1 Tax=Sphingomonas guangdongensis TaxID=1141890 RepID=UPI000BE368E0|nr:hypothetical protein [Sphingomonas guangdongensis]